MNNTILLMDSADGHSLALLINGYRMFQTTWDSVLAMDNATTPCRLVYSRHVPSDEQDTFRDRMVDDDNVWIADTDRGPLTGWSYAPQRLAKHLASLPKNDWPHSESLGGYRDSIGSI